MKRYKHNLSNYRLTTCDMGKLIPVGLQEALPGDTFQLSTSAMIRVSPLAAPVMHPVNVRIHHFFVPHRIVWDEWEDFITGGPDGNNASQIPVFDGVNTIVDNNSIHQYMGIPPQAAGVGSLRNWSALPAYGYNAIWNEYYRDQDLQTERLINDSTVADIGWGKDYFTTARPWTQKGVEVALSIGAAAPVKTSAGQQTSGVAPAMTWLYDTGFNVAAGNIGTNAVGQTQHQVGTAPGGALMYPNNLYADLSAATPVTINEFRRAFALQRYKEARARYGSRYTEYLRYLGVTPSDARLQRPEYLGGGTARVNFSEVLQTTPQGAYADEMPTDKPQGYGVGDLYGHGVAGLRSGRVRRFIEEHGYIHTFLSVRPKAIYMNGIHRTWLKRTKEDFFQKELEQIGQQAVYKAEIAAVKTDAVGAVFGYQDRYSEYKSTPSLVSGEFRSLLNFWHMARDLPDTTTLNEEFIKCVPTKRIHNVQNQHALWAMINNNVVARRMVRRSGGSRIL